MMTEHSLVGIDLAEVQMMTLGLKKLFPQKPKTVELKELCTQHHSNEEVQYCDFSTKYFRNIVPPGPNISKYLDPL